MASDDTVLSAAVGTGDTVRDLADSGGVKWPVAVVCYAVTISAGNNSLQIVDATHGLPVAVVGSVAVTGTFWQATQPVSAASLPLPTGAATAAKQPAIGTAGTASADVLTVQGIASMTALKVDGSAVTQPVSGTFWQTTQPVSGTVTANAGTGTFTVSGTVTVGNSTLAVTQSGTWTIATNADAAIGGTSAPSKLLLVGGKTADVTPAYDSLPLAAGGGSVVVSGTVAATQSGTWNVGTVTTLTGITNVVHVDDNSGSLTVDDGGGSLTVDGSLTTVATVTTVSTVSTVTSLSQWAGNVIDTNSGNKSAGTLRVVLATDQPALTNKLLVTPDANSAVNVAQIGGSSTATGHGTASGALRVELPTDGTGIVGLAAGTNNVGQVCLAPQTSGGLSTYSVISSGAANQDSAAVKGSAGQVYGYSLFNTTASARFVKLYNKASGATSADTPVRRILVPAGGGVDRAEPNGLAFGTGICIRITTGAGDSDTGACSANDVLANIDYK